MSALTGAESGRELVELLAREVASKNTFSAACVAICGGNCVAENWCRMAQDSSSQMPSDATNLGFSGTLVLFKSETVVPGGGAPGNGAGNAVSDEKIGKKIKLVFEAEPLTGGSATLTLTNDLPDLYLNNWDDVNQLEITQQQLPGATLCSKLSDDLGIEYTTDHELMLGWSLGISSSATIPPPVPVLPSGATAADPRGDNGTVNVDISTWVPCAYVVTLTTIRKLTNGDQEDDGHSSQIVFCKG